MGPHGICMRFVFRNMLTLSLSLSIGAVEATPRWSNGIPDCRALQVRFYVLYFWCVTRVAFYVTSTSYCRCEIVRNNGIFARLR